MYIVWNVWRAFSFLCSKTSDVRSHMGFYPFSNGIHLMMPRDERDQATHNLLSPQDLNLLNLPPKTVIFTPWCLQGSRISVTLTWLYGAELCTSLLRHSFNASFIPYLLQFSIPLIKITAGNPGYHLNILASTHYSKRCWLGAISNTVNKAVQTVSVTTKPFTCCALQLA